MTVQKYLIVNLGRRNKMGAQGMFSRIQDVTILSGATKSNIVSSKQVGDAWAVGIKAPASINTATGLTIEVCEKDDAGAGDVWATLEDYAGTAIAPPGAGKARTISEIMAFGSFRLSVTGAPNADTTWTVGKNFTG